MTGAGSVSAALITWWMRAARLGQGGVSTTPRDSFCRLKAAARVPWFADPTQMAKLFKKAASVKMGHWSKRCIGQLHKTYSEGESGLCFGVDE
jgi:hypothetical protein